MFDRDFKGWLGDFGFVKLLVCDMVVVIIKLVGIMVYMVFEFFIMFKFIMESDVYSFGILVLEVICWRWFFDGIVILLDWVWEKYE